MSRTTFASWGFLGAGFLLTCIGFAWNAMWSKLPLAPAGLLAGLALASVVLAWALARLFRCRAATAAAAAWLAALAFFAGLVPLAAVLLIAVAGMGVGSLLVPRDFPGRAAVAVVAGVAVMCGLDGWLLPFPIHGHTGYTLVLVAVCVLRWRAIAEMLAPMPRVWSEAVEGSPKLALLAVAALGVASTSAWVPIIHYDDLAYHLGLPYQLQELGYYRMDAGSRVWALSAWAGDVLHGIAQLVAESEAHGAVDAMWLVLAAALMWQLCRSMALHPGLRWLAVALYGSLPLTSGTLAGMQTEGATAAVATAVALLIQHAAAPCRRVLLLVALLMGVLLGLKISNLVIVGPLGLWLLWRWRLRLPWRQVPFAVLLALFVAGSSYLYAYLLTGNPVLPLFNEYFRSTYYGLYNFHDTSWDSGLHWNTVWNLTFHTSRFVEGGDGAGGFALLGLLGSLVVAVVRRQSRPLALIAALAFVLPLTQIQYLRYAHPVMALLLPAMLCGLPRGSPAGPARREWRVLVGMLMVLIGGNILFSANSDWQSQGGVLGQVLTEGGTAVRDRYAPTRRMAQVIRERYGAEARTLMLDPDRPFAAELAGNAFVTNWYDQQLSALATQARQDATPAGWSALFDTVGPSLVVVNATQRTPALLAALEKYRGAKVYEFGDLQLWELRPVEMGVAVAAPERALVVKFNAASTPQQAAMVTADVRLRCKVADVPIVISWSAAQVDGKSWGESEWATCTEPGIAEASMDVALRAKVTDLRVSAVPAKPVDLHLELDTASSIIRRDFAADRDLAARWRWHIVKLVKARNRARLASRRAAS